MTPSPSLERRLTEHYADEPPMRAPDRVLLATLATIETTRQRRGLFAPWRFTLMPTYAKVAAALAVIAVVAVGAWRLAPGTGGSGTPSASPTPLPSPTAAPTQRVSPTQAAYVPPPLSEKFTSERHGISLSYPAGWTVQPATEAWTGPNLVVYGEPAGDYLYDPARTDHLFIAVASQPLGGTSFEAWSAALLENEDCPSSEPIIVDGADGVRACDTAALFKGGRGYSLALYTSGDEADLRVFDSTAWFEEILATVQLQPATAID